MAYPRSLWSSVPRDGFPSSPQPSSAPPPRALDNAGYPSYPFADPDKTYSPAEFASKFPAQPPKYTLDECTSVADRELPNTTSTSPQRPGRYSHVHTNTDPATSETHLSEQRQSIQAGRTGPIDVSQSVLKDTEVASSDLNHSPTSASNSSGKAIQPPEVPTQFPNSVQLLDQSIDPLKSASQPAPLSYQGAYQSIFNRSSPPSALHVSLLDTHPHYNPLGSIHSDTTNTADTSPIRRQAHVFTLGQLETMPKRARSVDSVDSKAKSTKASSDSTTDIASDFADQAAASTDMGAAPSNVDRAPKNEYEARIIKAASKCNHIVVAYRDLAPDESTKRRGPMYMSHPPTYITDEEEKTYREEYESVSSTACYSLMRAAG